MKYDKCRRQNGCAIVKNKDGHLGIVVVGGSGGGDVVGVLTRESFLEANLKEKTGTDTSSLH